MPDLLHQGGLIMARKKRGIYADPAGTLRPNLEDKVADFSYENDALAQLIVEMWSGQHTNLITPSGSGTTQPQYQARSAAAKAILAERGIYLDFPIVVLEDEYDDGFHLAAAGLSADNGVVFVLPRKARTTTGKPLLETAKMLMAVTPNGI